MSITFGGQISEGVAHGLNSLSHWPTCGHMATPDSRRMLGNAVFLLGKTVSSFRAILQDGFHDLQLLILVVRQSSYNQSGFKCDQQIYNRGNSVCFPRLEHKQHLRFHFGLLKQYPLKKAHSMP